MVEVKKCLSVIKITLRYSIFRWLLLLLPSITIATLFIQNDLLETHQTESRNNDDISSFGLLDDREVRVGDVVPDFILQDLDGNRIRLSNFLGKTIVLNFWATWCPPCRAEMPDFQETYEKRLSQDDLVVIAVDLLAEDSLDAVTSFVHELSLTFPIVLANDNSVPDRYGVFGLPATFFIDRHGVLRSTNLGPVFGDLLETGIAIADASGSESDP